MIIAWIILISLVSGLFYRLGGSGDEWRKKYPNLPAWLFDTKARDIGCTILGFITMFILLNIKAVWWVHLLAFLGLFGSLTTYWDFLFGYDNFWFHGFMCALSYVWYPIVTGNWIGFGIRCVVVSVAMGWISSLLENDNGEEFSRGFWITITLPLMLI